MDLRAYYQKIRTIEAGLQDTDVVVVSRRTAEGGRPGVKTDVPRRVAARLIADEKAELATPEEAAQFHKEIEERWKGAMPGGRETRPLQSARTPQRKARAEREK